MQIWDKLDILGKMFKLYLKALIYLNFLCELESYNKTDFSYYFRVYTILVQKII